MLNCKKIKACGTVNLKKSTFDSRRRGDKRKNLKVDNSNAKKSFQFYCQSFMFYYHLRCVNESKKTDFMIREALAIIETTDLPVTCSFSKYHQ